MGGCVGVVRRAGMCLLCVVLFKVAFVSVVVFCSSSWTCFMMIVCCCQVVITWLLHSLLMDIGPILLILLK